MDLDTETLTCMKSMQIESFRPMHVVKENSIYKREREKPFTNAEKITFFQPEERVYEKAEYDWYMTVALEKVDKVIGGSDDHLLTAEVIISYRNAIREGYNHNLDHSLKSSCSYPSNRNTVKGIISYTKRMLEKAYKFYIK